METKSKNERGKSTKKIKKGGVPEKKHGWFIHVKPPVAFGPPVALLLLQLEEWPPIDNPPVL